MTALPNSTRAYRAAFMAQNHRRRMRWLAALTCTCSAVAMLTGCGESQSDQTTGAWGNESVLVYKSLAECKAAQSDDQICDVAYEDARGWQEQQPGYTHKEWCEAEYGAGNCESRSNGFGGSWFVPAMAGFMLSNAMNNMSRNAYMKARREDEQGAYPVYVNSGGYVSTYSGRGMQPLGHRVPPGTLGRTALPSRLDLQRDPTGRGYVAPGTFKPQSSYRSDSRGGFGGTSSFRGGCCS